MRNVIVLVIGIAVLFSGNSSYGAPVDVTPENMKPVLEKANGRIAEWTRILDRDLSDAAGQLSTIDLTSDKARMILRELCIGRSSIIHTDIVNNDGKLVTVEPVDFAGSHEGNDLNKYEHITKVRQTQKPVLSSVFISSDSVSSFALEYPIFADDGSFRGSVNIVVKPHLFFDYIMGPILKDMPCKIWVMQTDGLVIYDPDPEQISKNIFTDPMFAPFKGLIEFSKKVITDKSGVGSYDFYAKGYEDKTVVRKDAVWDTVTTYGTEWRVIVMEIAK